MKERDVSEQRESDSLVRELLESLDDQERQVMIVRYLGKGAPRTIEEAAAVLGIAAADVVSIEASALSKLPPPESGWPGRTNP
jgi:DNA-directed RNA polymerase sigma subunit (sigma70/sigma32)